MHFSTPLKVGPHPIASLLCPSVSAGAPETLSDGGIYNEDSVKIAYPPNTTYIVFVAHIRLIQNLELLVQEL